MSEKKTAQSVGVNGQKKPKQHTKKEVMSDE
jgi:hypothetical protein